MSQAEPERPASDGGGAGFGMLDCAVMAALSREIRIEILWTLIERAASQRELAGKVGAPLSAVRHHTDCLLEADLIHREGAATDPGAAERRYRANWSRTRAEEFWEECPHPLRPALRAWVAQQAFIEARHELAEVAGEDSELDQACLALPPLERAAEEEVLELSRRCLEALPNLPRKERPAPKPRPTDHRRMRDQWVLLGNLAICQDSQLRARAGRTSGA